MVYKMIVVKNQLFHKSLIMLIGVKKLVNLHLQELYELLVFGIKKL